MLKAKNRLLALLLSLAMLFSTLPAAALATEVEPETDAATVETVDDADAAEEATDTTADETEETATEDVAEVTDEADTEDAEEAAEESVAEEATEEVAEEVASEDDISVTSEVAAADDSTTVTEDTTRNNKPADGTTTDQPFSSGTGGSSNFRIPAMVTLDDGTIVAACDARWNTTNDWGGLDTIVSYSTDNGATWNYTFANYLGDNGNSYNVASSTFIDPALATDGETIWMLVDLYPDNTKLSSTQAGTGYDSNSHLLLSDDSGSTYGYYVGDYTDGYANIYSTDGTQVSGYTVDEYFYLYENGTCVSNLFFDGCTYSVLPTSYLYLTSSTDGGKTWSAPTMLNSQVKTSSDKFYGVCPGTGIVTSTGRIIFACYNSNSTEYTSFIYSDDNGKTWTRTSSLTAVSSEATIVEADGMLYAFTRTSSSDYSNITYYTSSDNGATWSSKIDDSGIDPYTGCQMNAIVYSEKIDGKTAILLSCPTGSSYRVNGKITVGLVQDDGTIDWAYSYEVTGSSSSFAYSCLTELADGSISLLYEYTNGYINYINVDIADIADGAIIGSSITSTEDDGVADVTAVATGVTLSSISVEKTNTTTSTGTVSVEYSVTLNGGDYTGSATLYIPLDSALANCNSFTGSVANSDGTSDSFDVTLVDGYLVCTVPHFSTITINGESVEYTSEVDVTLYVGQSVSYETDATETSTEIDSSVATAEIGSTTVTYDARLGTTSSFTGDYTNLENALYTFTGSTSAGWVISNTTSDGTTVYVNISADNNNGYPNKTTSDTLTLTYYSDGFTITTTVNGKVRNLAFLNSSYSNPYIFDEGDSGVNSTGVYQFYIYRQATDDEEGSTELPGYVKVTSLSDISSGSQYLIVAYRNSNYYVLYPSTDTSNKYTHVAKVLGSDTVSETTNAVTFTGVAAGTTSVIVDEVLYNITVYEVTGYSSVELEGGASTTVSISELDSDFTVPEGGSVEWTVGDTDVAGVYNTSDTGASIIAHAEGETTVTAKVYDADGNLVGTYVWTVTVTSTYGEGSRTYTWTVTEVVYNGTLYYSIDGSDLIEATDYTETTDSDGNTIRTYTITYTSSNVAYTGLIYFIKPDEGYAVTSVKDTGGTTYNQFYGTETVQGYYTKAAFQTAYSLTHSGGWPTDIMSNAEWDAIVAQAIAAGCDAVYWNTETGTIYTKTYSYTNYCDKLPTVDKVITSLTRGDETITYEEGTTEVKVGDVINYTVTVTTYYEHANIVYSDASLTDTMSSGSGANATFSDGSTTYTVTDYLGNNTTQTSQTATSTYTVTYTVTQADLDSELLNTVALDYDYSSSYSTGSYGGTASAECRVNLVSFTPDDIVVDFGLPVTIDYSGTDAHGSYNLVSGTATYGTVTVSENKVTYTPTTVLTGVDTVTLVNEKNATYTFSVYPATTVYYEEGFATYGNGWSVEACETWSNTDNKGKDPQETHIANSETSYNNYNYDGEYADDTTGSDGTAASTTKAGDSLTFTFTGTGVDLFANCDETSGTVIIRVTGSEGVEKLLYVNMADTGKYATGEGTTAYNTPIASISELAHGEHTVTIYLNDASESGFKFDGFRVYDTIDEETDTTTSAVYTNDLEDNPVYYELRNYVLYGLKADTDSSTYKEDLENELAQVYAIGDVDTEEGAVVVYSSNSNLLKSTTDEEGDDTSVQTFLDDGPKNELYLDTNASVTFKITTDREVQIGLRSVTGASVTYTISDGTNSTSYTTSSSVDMFYDLQAKGATSETTYTITVTDGGILSITDIKVCDSTGESIFGSLTADEVVAALTGETSEAETADAVLTVNLADYTGSVIASTQLTATGVAGESATFAASDILSAVSEALPDGYALADEDSVSDQTVTCGESATLTLQVGKVATLTVTYQKYSGLFKKTTVGTVTLTKVQTGSGSKATFSASEIKAAVPSGYKVLIATSASVSYGSSATKTVTVY